MKKVLIVAFILFFVSAIVKLSGTDSTPVEHEGSNIKQLRTRGWSSNDLGIRFLKLSNTWRKAENFLFSKQALKKAEKLIPQNGSYWNGALYEFASYLLYDKDPDSDEAKELLIEAYYIFRDVITEQSGSDEAVFELIKIRYDGDWSSYIDEDIHKKKQLLKIKISQNEKFTIEKNRRKLKLFITYLEMENQLKAKMNLRWAKNNIEKIKNKYWHAAWEENNALYEMKFGDPIDAEVSYCMAYHSYFNLINMENGSDDAVLSLIDKEFPDSECADHEVQKEKNIIRMLKPWKSRTKVTLH